MVYGRVIDMKEILEIINLKEKEYIFIIVVIDMRGILKMIKEKEKEYINIIMEIEQWEII